MYQRIVVGTDGSPGANAALEQAIEIARLSGAVLHVVTAHKSMSAYAMAGAAGVGVPSVDVTESEAAMHADAESTCDQAVERAKAAGVRAEGHCVVADPAEALLNVGEGIDCDLIVVGNLGMSGARRFLLGSVPNKLSHHCPSSLLIVDTSKARG